MSKRRTYDELATARRIAIAGDRQLRRALIRDDLNATAKEVYALIALRQRERRGNQVCPMRAIADALGIALSTAERAVRALRRAGLVRSIARYGARGVRIASRIILTSYSVSKNPHFNTPSSVTGSTRARGLALQAERDTPPQAKPKRGGVCVPNPGHKLAAPGLRPGGSGQERVLVEATPPPQSFPGAGVRRAGALPPIGARDRDTSPAWAPEPSAQDPERRSKLLRWRQLRAERDA